MVSWYRVEVSDHDGQIVAIEPEMLCGRDIGDAERATIQAAIDTLAGFIGQPNFREMYANEAHAKMMLMEHYSSQETVPAPEASLVKTFARSPRRVFSSINPRGPNGECPNCGGLPGNCKPGCQDGSEHF